MNQVYQIRGFDLSNMTLIEGDTGLIVVDPLLGIETASAALDLYYQYRPRRPVVAVIYTHTHTDHWGGVKGVTSEGDVASGKVGILAPEGFLEYAVSEKCNCRHCDSSRTRGFPERRVSIRSRMARAPLSALDVL